MSIFLFGCVRNLELRQDIEVEYQILFGLLK
jgi:hypothetical protein